MISSFLLPGFVYTEEQISNGLFLLLGIKLIATTGFSLYRRLFHVFTHAITDHLYVGCACLRSIALETTATSIVPYNTRNGVLRFLTSNPICEGHDA